MSNIIKVKDANGNWVGIPALQGEPGITPHIGENGNWFIGEEDTGIKAAVDLTPYATTEYVTNAIDNIDIPEKTSELTNDSGFITKSVNDLDNYYTKSVLNEAFSEIEIPTNTSELVNDSGFITEHQDISHLAEKSELPTKVSELTNDTGFITNTVNNLTNYYKKSEIYTQTEVNNLINAITTLNIEVVSSLPTSNISTTTIYLKGSKKEGTNSYEEYIYVNGTWELIGTTAIDLTPYATKTYVDTEIDGITKSSLGLGNVENKSSATIRGEITNANVTAALGFTPAKESHTHTASQITDLSKSSIGLANVENKSSATIRGELTSANVTNALGYTPLKDAYTLPVATSSTLGGIKSGTDITVDASGNVSVNDNSHNHSAANITAGTLSSDRLPTVPITKGGTGATTAEGALTNLGITATAAELNYTDGVTSNIQTQLNAKATKEYVDSAVANAGSGGSGISSLTRTTNAYFGW